MKHVPMRSCIVCRKARDKSELVRVVRTPSGEVLLDETGKAAGRGAYICADGECMKSAIKKRALNKAFKTQLDQSVYDGLEAAYAGLKTDE